MIPSLWLGVIKIVPKAQFRKVTNGCDWIACKHAFLSFYENYKLNKITHFKIRIEGLKWRITFHDI